MEFDKSKVFTVFNFDEIKIGSKVYADDCGKSLIKKVESENGKLCTLIEIYKEADRFPFTVEDVNGKHLPFQFVYLVEEPEEKKLKVSDLKLGDIVRHKSGNLEYIVIGIDHDENVVFFETDWYSDEELENWEKVEND